MTLNLSEQDRDEARNVFHVPPQMLNCAQSVMAATGHDEVVTEFAAYGGGRAPGGLCGALYAALMQLPADRRDEFTRQFREFTGAETCREIKCTGKIPCLDCVACALKLLQAEKNEPEKR